MYHFYRCFVLFSLCFLSFVQARAVPDTTVLHSHSPSPPPSDQARLFHDPLVYVLRRDSHPDNIQATLSPLVTPGAAAELGNENVPLGEKMEWKIIGIGGALITGIAVLTLAFAFLHSWGAPKRTLSSFCMRIHRHKDEEQQAIDIAFEHKKQLERALTLEAGHRYPAMAMASSESIHSGIIASKHAPFRSVANGTLHTFADVHVHVQLA